MICSVLSLLPSSIRSSQSNSNIHDLISTISYFLIHFLCWFSMYCCIFCENYTHMIVKRRSIWSIQKKINFVYTFGNFNVQHEISKQLLASLASVYFRPFVESQATKVEVYCRTPSCQKLIQNQWWIHWMEAGETFDKIY